MDAPLPFNSRRSPVLGRRGMVATSQPLAAMAGLAILERGGGAADAAVAAGAALNVTEPTSTGIGGDCFALYYDAASRSVHALNGSGRSPHDLTLERLRREGFGDELPPFHAHTVTVPGACAGWADLVEAHGRLPLAEALEPAIHLAEGGFPVAPITAFFWARGAERQLRDAPGGRALTIDGRGPLAGEVFRNPGLARTFRAIAEGGKQAFYEGEIAAAIAAAVQAAGGALKIEDLAAHESTWDRPISTVYRGLTVWQCPPNGQGLATLLALNILEGFDLAALDPLGPERLHLVIEALRLAFADANWYVADPETDPAPLEALLGSPYSEARRAMIDPAEASPRAARGATVAGSDTVYLTVVDADGNACSFINSNYMGFGTGIVPEGWGFSLQNRGHNFSLDPAHPNALAPGKRPFHTIIPGMATRADGSLDSSFGVMGGYMQPQGQVQVLLALVDDGEEPQAALDRPRLCLLGGDPDGRIAVEEGIPEPTVRQLAHLGHRLEPVSGQGRAVFGRGQIIRLDPESGVRWGASDPRADGCAVAQL